jgi:hypothetical protein
MGDDAAFFDCEGIARPAFVAALKALPEPPRDPELLARLIDAHAGVDLDLSLVGFEAARRAARREVLEVMTGLKRGAQLLCALQNKHPELNLLEIALQDLTERAGPDDVSSAYISQLSAAVEHLAGVPLPSDLSSFGKKPPNDEAVQHVVDAVAEYYARLGIGFTGAPRRTQTDKGPAYPLYSEQAKLTAAVIETLSLSIPDKALATYIGKARKTAAAGLPTDFRTP